MENKKKHQILLIWGGETFDSNEAYLNFLENYEYDPSEKHKSWKWWLLSWLSDNFDGIRVSMPATQNSYYPAWKIWFEKYFKYLWDNKIILIWHSLGGIFLAKYLSENHFPKLIDSLHLISPVFDNSGLIWESTASFSYEKSSLWNILKQTKDIHLWHSKDDNIVPFEHSMKYHTILTWSNLHTFDDRWHFTGQSHFVELFLEIQKAI
jgi:predicted alpha/beta hydrolase family esterase